MWKETELHVLSGCFFFLFKAAIVCSFFQGKRMLSTLRYYCSMLPC